MHTISDTLQNYSRRELMPDVLVIGECSIETRALAAEIERLGYATVVSSIADMPTVLKQARFNIVVFDIDSHAISPKVEIGQELGINTKSNHPMPMIIGISGRQLSEAPERFHQTVWIRELLQKPVDFQALAELLGQSTTKPSPVAL